MAVITVEKDKEGKRKFPNKEIREAELRRRLKDDQIYKEFKDELTTNNYKINIAKIELDFLTDILKRNKYLIKHRTSTLSNYEMYI